MYEIIFCITSNVCLCIPLLISEQKLHLYSAGSLVLRREGQDDVTIYRNGPLFSAIDRLHYMLRDAVAGNLELHPTCIEKSIGYRYSEYVTDRLDDSHLTDLGYWVGSKYELCCSGRDHIVVSMYTLNQRIFIDVSDYYFWHEDYEPEAGEKYIPYDEYMAKFTPIAVLEISRETAQEWIKKSGELIEIMRTNSEKIENA